MPGQNQDPEDALKGKGMRSLEPGHRNLSYYAVFRDERDAIVVVLQSRPDPRIGKVAAPLWRPRPPSGQAWSSSRMIWTETLLVNGLSARPPQILPCTAAGPARPKSDHAQAA
jgi:hypothetical protein